MTTNGKLLGMMNNFSNALYWWKKLLKTRQFNHYMFFYTINKGWHDMNFENFYGKGIVPETIYVSAEAFDAICDELEAL